jgi:hypothetical protein
MKSFVECLSYLLLPSHQDFFPPPVVHVGRRHVVDPSVIPPVIVKLDELRHRSTPADSAAPSASRETAPACRRSAGGAASSGCAEQINLKRVRQIARPVVADQPCPILDRYVLLPRLLHDLLDHFANRFRRHVRLQLPQWQSDASYVFVVGWGRSYQISVLEDFSSSSWPAQSGPDRAWLRSPVH